MITVEWWSFWKVIEKQRRASISTELVPRVHRLLGQWMIARAEVDLNHWIFHEPRLYPGDQPRSPIDCEQSSSFLWIVQLSRKSSVKTRRD